MKFRTLNFVGVGLLLLIPSVAWGVTGMSYEEVSGGLDDPTDMVFLWDGVPGIVIERCGDIERVDENDVIHLSSLKSIVNCQQAEAGLIGAAAAITSDTSANLFLYFTVKGGAPKQHRVVRVPIERDGATVTLSLGAQTTIIDELPAFQVPRGGGGLSVGSDSMLYVGVGDDGNTNAVQDLSMLHGKVLRLTLDGSVPNDNPSFAGASANARPEIFSIGVRRPVGVEADSQSGDVWIADVGAGLQEVNRSAGGENFGWPAYEGETLKNGSINLIGGTQISAIETYKSSGGMPMSVVIGAPYRAESGLYRFPDTYTGSIPMADFYQSWVKVLKPNGDGWATDELVDSGPVNVRAIVTGLDGGLYFVEAGKNAISRLVWTDKPPEVTIESPNEDHRYGANETLQLTASAIDDAQGSLESGFTWTVTLFGGDDNVQDEAALTGQSTEYTLPGQVDTEGRLEIHVSVTDEAGSTGTASMTLQPGATSVTFATVPEEGIGLTIDGEEITPPITRLYLPGTVVQVACPQEVIMGDGFDLYTFVGWSDDGEPSHDYTVPDADVTLTCTLSLHGPPPTADEPQNNLVDTSGLDAAGTDVSSGGGSKGGCTISSRGGPHVLWVFFSTLGLLLIGVRLRQLSSYAAQLRTRVTRPKLWA